MAEPVTLLSGEQMRSLCGISPSGLSRWVKIGVMPKKIRGTNKWSESAVRGAIAKLDRPERESRKDPKPSQYDSWMDAHG